MKDRSEEGRKGKLRPDLIKVDTLEFSSHHLHHLLCFLLLLFRVRVALQSFSLLSTTDQLYSIEELTLQSFYRFLTEAHFPVTTPRRTTSTTATERLELGRQEDTSGSDSMASTMRSTVTKVLAGAVAISSIVGLAMAQEAPAPGPLGQSAAAGLLPATMMTSLLVAVTGFVAARCL